MSDYKKTKQKYQELIKEIKLLRPIYKLQQKEFAEAAVILYEGKLLKLTPPANLKSLIANLKKCDICNHGNRGGGVDYPDGFVEYIFISTKDAITLFGSRGPYVASEPEVCYYIYPYLSEETSLYPIYTLLFDPDEKEIEFEITTFESLLTHRSEKFRKFAKEL